MTETASEKTSGMRSRRQSQDRIILDPSILVGGAPVDWLLDETMRPFLAVSSALVNRLSDLQSLPELEQFGEGATADRVEQLRSHLEGLHTFSWTSVEDTSPGAAAIRENLLSSNEVLADVMADEWVFLVSESWGIVSAARRTLRAFERRGAQVYEISHNRMELALASFRERIPPDVVHGMKALGEIEPVLAVGGRVVEHFFPQLGLPVEILDLVLAGTAVIAGDP